VSIPTSTTEAIRVETNDWCHSSPTAQNTTPITANKDHRHFHDAVEPPRKARNNRRPRVKYSMT